MLPALSRFSETIWAHIIYLLCLAAIWMALPPTAFSYIGNKGFLFISALGFWRFAWGGLHLVRSLIYRNWRFPVLRRRAVALALTDTPPHAFLLVTSFRIPAQLTSKVYRGTFRAALAAPGKATVIASIVDLADQHLIKRVFEVVVGNSDKVDLEFVRIEGTGKRDALAYGFRAIAARRPSDDAVVAVIDGDTIVPDDLIAKTAYFFRLDPQVGALTSDEVCEVEGNEIFRRWYELRFAQRHVLMSSMGLAGRVLTLTGRMSLFRAGIICDPDFIRQVELDYIDHWRLGQFKFLTGDDKSSWYWLLKNGYKMIYVPDVVVMTVEQPPDPNFFKSAFMLMRRWFGNMLRTNERAIALGPRKIGFFAWWAVLDQRVSMWTCLTGPTAAILGTVFVSPWVIVIYAFWVLASRYVLSAVLLTARPSFSVFNPFLLYFNQIFGAFIKTFVFFRLDKQKWTRQQTVLKSDGPQGKAKIIAWSSTAMHLLAIATFTALIAMMLDIA